MHISALQKELKGLEYLTVRFQIPVRHNPWDISPRERDAMRYTIDGNTFDTLAGFLDTLDVTLRPVTPWSRDLDGLNNLLRMDNQAPSEGMTLVWSNSTKSRADLGYEETLRVLQARLKDCDGINVRFLKNDIVNARDNAGPTVFDWVIEVIERHGPGGDEGWDNVRLVLE